MNWNQKKVFVTGHRGMVGSAVVRALANRDCQAITATRDQLDLCDQAAVSQFFADTAIDTVIFCAGKVGGIHANNAYPAEFMQQNLLMAVNAIHSAYTSKVARFLYLGSTCIYPSKAPQPMSEDCLLTGPLEKTNEAYALAKIAGLKMCEFYRRQHGVLFHSAMPANLYGPRDNYHPENSHVLPALIQRIHLAKETGDASVTIWGTGTPRREFLHVDDLADGLLHLCGLENPPDLVNVGTGKDLTILELAQAISKVIGFEGEILTDPTKPDGPPVKRTDTTRMNSTCWSAKIDLLDGIQQTYEDFLEESKAGLLRQA